MGFFVCVIHYAPSHFQCSSHHQCCMTPFLHNENKYWKLLPLLSKPDVPLSVACTWIVLNSGTCSFSGVQLFNKNEQESQFTGKCWQKNNRNHLFPRGVLIFIFMLFLCTGSLHYQKCEENSLKHFLRYCRVTEKAMDVLGQDEIIMSMSMEGVGKRNPLSHT